MTKITEENLSQRKYAEHINVTKGYIGRLFKEGRLHLIKGKLNVEWNKIFWDSFCPLRKTTYASTFNLAYIRQISKLL